MTKQEAIANFGSIKALAAALGITREAVYQWGETVPLLRAYEIRDILAHRAAADRFAQVAECATQPPAA